LWSGEDTGWILTRDAGRRIQKAGTYGTSNFVYDGNNQIEELNSAGAVVARYAQGLGIDEPLALYRSGKKYYHHADGLGRWWR
jgi:hypothetical protein